MNRPGESGLAAVVKGQIDPIHYNLNPILDFLGGLFDAGYEYGTINCHRSAISVYHADIEGNKVSSNPKVCNLISEVFKARPPQRCPD